MTIERGLRLIAGTVVLLSVALAWFHGPYWIGLTPFVGLNLFQSAFTNWCPMVWLLGRVGIKPCVAGESSEMPSPVVIRQRQAILHGRGVSHVSESGWKPKTDGNRVLMDSCRDDTVLRVCRHSDGGRKSSTMDTTVAGEPRRDHTNFRRDRDVDSASSPG